MKKNTTPIGKMSQAQTEVSDKITDMALDQIFDKAYDGFTDEQKKEWDEVFDSSDDKKKDEIVRKYIPGFDQLYIDTVTRMVLNLKKMVEEHQKKK